MLPGGYVCCSAALCFRWLLRKVKQKGVIQHRKSTQQKAQNNPIKFLFILFFFPLSLGELSWIRRRCFHAETAGNGEGWVSKAFRCLCKHPSYRNINF